ncbi:unnamed protein product [Coregonus sp. 'balchen']|nr:unnamed protein product [Coregonus sp. 'balchen']
MSYALSQSANHCKFTSDSSKEPVSGAKPRALVTQDSDHATPLQMFFYFPSAGESILLLGGVALACLALDLLFLLFYSFWLCCRRKKSEEQPNADCCCTAWCVIIATLVCSAGIAVGFYGNGETCDGVNRLTYSLRHANRTVAGVQKLVSDSTGSLKQTVDGSLGQLEGQYAKHTDYLSIIQKLQGQLDELVRQMVEIPFWDNREISLEELAVNIELYDWYRWLGYLGLLLFNILICLLVLFGLIRNSKGTLIGDFCVAPDMFVTQMTEQYGVLNKGRELRVAKADVNWPIHNQSRLLLFSLPLTVRVRVRVRERWEVSERNKLSGSHKALVEMQDDLSELLRSATREYPQTKGNLEQIQGVLNTTEIGLHQLTALVDCRSLHMVSCLPAWDYRGTMANILTPQGVLNEADSEEESMAHGGRLQNHDNLYRVHMPSLYSCGSSYGSETSIPAAAHTVSNAPVTEYM